MSDAKKRVIRRGPLIDLTGLQDALTAAEFDLDDIWIATDRCQRDLENNQWEYGDVVHMLRCLQANDYKNSEWCQIKHGSVVACDVYRMRYDDSRGVRSMSGLEVYLKFSLSTAGVLSLVLVSCHPSR